MDWQYKILQRPKNGRNFSKRENRRQRKYVGVKSWESGVKIRGLSGNVRTKKTELYYKSVALIYF